MENWKTKIKKDFASFTKFDFIYTKDTDIKHKFARCYFYCIWTTHNSLISRIMWCVSTCHQYISSVHEGVTQAIKYIIISQPWQVFQTWEIGIVNTSSTVVSDRESWHLQREDTENVIILKSTHSTLSEANNSVIILRMRQGTFREKPKRTLSH